MLKLSASVLMLLILIVPIDTSASKQPRTRKVELKPADSGTIVRLIDSEVTNAKSEWELIAHATCYDKYGEYKVVRDYLCCGQEMKIIGDTEEFQGWLALYRGYLRFDIGKIPDKASIASAKLTFYKYQEIVNVESPFFYILLNHVSFTRSIKP